VLQNKENHEISKSEAWSSKGKIGTFPIGFNILQTLQVLNKTRAESRASALDQIIKVVPPEGGGTGAVAADETVGVATGVWHTHFDDSSLDDFL
jgi:hypothetical protein